ECSTWNISPAGRPGRWPLQAPAMFHVEHRSIPRCSTRNTPPSTEETALPRCSTWNIRRTDQAVDRARASKVGSGVFHVEHFTRRSSWTLAPPRLRDVPRGTSVHPEMFTGHTRRSSEETALPRCSTWNIRRTDQLVDRVRDSQVPNGTFHVEQFTRRSS